MKKLILLALTAVIMVGCKGKPLKENSAVRILELDSCEYLIKMGLSNGIAHKGNCRFCAERRKQEMKELVEQLKEK